MPIGRGKNNSKHEAALQALRSACSRSRPVSVVRYEFADIHPHAKGRLLEVDPDIVTVDALQIIGRDTMIHAGHAVDVFFALNDDIYTFRTRVVSTTTPTRLDNGMLIAAVTLVTPDAVEDGQRRSAFRVMLASRERPVTVELFRGDADRGGDERAEGEPGWVPAAEARPQFVGELVDCSERGMGVVVRDRSHTSFGVFGRWVCRLRLPALERPLHFLTEVRRARRISDHRRRDARLGLIVLEHGDAKQRFRMRQWLGAEEREALKRRKTVA